MFGLWLAPDHHCTAVSYTPINLGLSAAAGATANKSSLCLVVNSDTASETGADWRPLADWLVAAGNTVTVVDLGRTSASTALHNDFTYHRLAGQFQEKHWYLPIRSLLTYHWLKHHNFEHIIFWQDFGSSYFSTVAQGLGLAFQDTILSGWITAPLAARLAKAEQFPDGRTDIEQDYIERQSAARLAQVIIDTPETLNWLQQAGWTLPKRTAIPTLTAQSSLQDWLQQSRRALPTVGLTYQTQDIFISVLLATYNRPERLRRAIASLQAQTATNFELIVVDDGSTNGDVQRLKSELAPLFTARGWQWIEQANTGPAKARNRVLELGRGSHIMFMDDDNLALPGEIACFTTAATRGADILTCLPGLQTGSDVAVPPLGCIPSLADPANSPLWAAWAPVGGCLPLALFTNPFGDTNSLFRREAFAALGGFQGDRLMAFEDFELLTRAVIAGYRLEVIPEILFMYLRHWGSRSIGATIFNSHLESLRPLAALLPPWLRAGLLLPRAHWYNQTCKLKEGQNPS
jgi:glycosyltransferase involved in cell wall biosynthesis